MNTNNLHSRCGRGARWAIAGGMSVGLLLSGAAVAQTGGGGGASSAHAGTLGGEPGSDVQSSTSISVNENGHQYKIEMKNGVVTLAQIDGQNVPDDRIENDGDVVRLKDDKGAVVYEYRVPGDLGMMGQGVGAIGPGTPFWPSLGGVGVGGAGVPGAMGLNGLGAMGLGGPQSAMVAPEPGEAPSVMMGVQMGVPDSTLCGHLGIDRDKSTLLTAVHETLPAAAAGLAPYDVIVSIDGKDGASPMMIREALKDKKPGDTLKLGVIHKGVHEDVSVKLQAYDWQKLSSAKADRIATDGNDVFALATAPSAPLPPLPASIPQEYRKQIEQYLKDNNLSKSFTINRFGTRAPLADADQQRLLEQIERQQTAAAQRSRELARLMAGQGFAVPDPGEMRQRMERMEQMLERLMNERLQQSQPQTQPQAPEAPEAPAKDPATQS